MYIRLTSISDLEIEVPFKDKCFLNKLKKDSIPIPNQLTSKMRVIMINGNKSLSSGHDLESQNPLCYITKN